MIDGVSSVTATLSRMALDAYMQRYEVLANNIANVDSADFRPLQVNFEQQLSQLQDAVSSGKATDQQILAIARQVHPFIEPAPEEFTGIDQAGRLDQQMTQLTQNTLQYETLLSALDQLGSINRLAVDGGTV